MKQMEIDRAIKKCIKKGNWIIRADNDGISANKEANRFKWNPLGQWTKAPDWNTNAQCGGGLHGQDREHGGYILGRRLVFCDTYGPHIDLGDKVKVQKARILKINSLPEGLQDKIIY